MKRLSGKFQPNALLSQDGTTTSDNSNVKQESSNGQATKHGTIKTVRRRKSFGALGPRNSFSEAGGRSSAGEGSSKFMNQQLASMYSRVIQMSTENKINAKNTWGLNFIDHMDKIVDSQRDNDDGQLNFQKASCALDASVKIYSYRVDDTWTTSYRVLENLNRTDRDDSENASEDPSERKKQGKKKSKGDSKIEQNMNNITLKKFDTEFEVDPLFHKMSQTFDEGGAQGMLLNNLSVSNGCELVFDSTDIPDTDGSENCSNEDISQENLIYFVNSSSLLQQLSKTQEIQRANYSISGLGLPNSIMQLYSMLNDSANPGDKSSKSESSAGNENCSMASETEGADEQTDLKDISRNLSLLSSEEEGSMNTEMNSTIDPNGVSLELTANLDDSSNLSMNDSVSFEPNADFNEPDDGGDDDDNFDNDSSSVVSELMNVVGNNTERSSNKENTSEQRQATTSDYQYFDEHVMDNLRVWAGPHHWKCNKNRLVTKKSTSKSTGKTKKASEQYIDFSLDTAFDRSVLDPPKRNAGSTAMTQKERKEQDKDSCDKYLLPEDMQLSTDNFAHLFLMSDQSLSVPIQTDGNVAGNGSLRQLQKQERRNTSKDVDEDLQNDFGAPDDDDDDGFDIAGDFDMGTSACHDSSAPADDDGSHLQMEGQELLTAARRVGRIEVNYAKNAKKIDVQRLKTKLWSYVEEKEADAAANAEPASFQKAVKDAAEDMPRNITAPIYFICMLHLANEHNLNLEQDHSDDVADSEGLDMSDFRIMRNQ